MRSEALEKRCSSGGETANGDHMEQPTKEWEFMHDLKHLPTFTEQMDRLVDKYVFGLGNWVTTNIEWSFKGERYFGERGMEVKAQLVFELQPRKVDRFRENINMLHEQYAEHKTECMGTRRRDD